MENQKNDFEKYVKARRRVDAIKRFYFHLIQYLIITILIISFKGRILDFFISKGVENPDVLNWMEMNILAIPIIWGLVLSVMGLSLFIFRSNRIKNWEERQIRKYLESDKEL